MPRGAAARAGFSLGALLAGLSGASLAAADAICPARPAPGMPARGISAHRGGCETCPENSLGAFRHAIALGVHQIEFDVRATLEGELVIHHDASARAIDGRRLAIAETTLSELRREVALAPCEGDTAVQRIPALRELLAIVPGNVWLNVEIKAPEPWVAAEATRILCRERRLHQAAVGVRDEAGRRAARAAHPQVRINDMDRSLFKRCYIRDAVAHCDDFIQLHYVHTRPKSADTERLHAAGIRVNYCCVQERAHCASRSLRAPAIADLFDAGVDFVLADDPGHALEEAAKLGIPPNRPSYEPGPACELP